MSARCLHGRLFANKFYKINFRSCQYTSVLCGQLLSAACNLVWITIACLKPKVVSLLARKKKKKKKKVGSTSCHFTLNLVSLVERPFRIKIDVYWWGNSVPRLFMFKLLAGNGTTFEALEHNGALDTGSWERRELDAIQGPKQPTRKRSRRMMEDCLLFPVLSSSGRLNPVKNGSAYAKYSC